jgi:hypothetical protein
MSRISGNHRRLDFTGRSGRLGKAGLADLMDRSPADFWRGSCMTFQMILQMVLRVDLEARSGRHKEAAKWALDIPGFREQMNMDVRYKQTFCSLPPAYCTLFV